MENPIMNMNTNNIFSPEVIKIENAFKHHMVKAVYDWCYQQALDCYLFVSVDEHCQVPEGYVEDGEIVFSLHPESCIHLSFEKTHIKFDAMFGEAVQTIIIPIERVKGIYDAEYDKGLDFLVLQSQALNLNLNQNEENIQGNIQENNDNNHTKNKSLFKIIK